MPKADHMAELVRALASRGDRAAFVELFRHFAPRVKAFLQRSGAASEVAEDLAQETLVRVWRRAASYDPTRAQLSTWIYTIARNLLADERRRKTAAQSATTEADEEWDAMTVLAEEGEGPDALLDGKRRADAVRDALRLLDPEQLGILSMSFYGEQSHADIAAALGLPLGTVKSRIRRALGRLHTLLHEMER